MYRYYTDRKSTRTITKEGKSMKFKRILAVIICAAMLTPYAFASALQINAVDETLLEHMLASEEDKNASQDNSTDNSVTTSNPGLLRPKEYYTQLFYQILKLYINEHLYEATEEEVLLKMAENMINSNPYLFKYIVNSMLSALDPYSSYHEADSGFLSVENTQKGYGITVQNSLKGTKILSVVPGSPAEAAGLKAGDEIISLCGYNVENLPKTAVMLILSNPYIFVYDPDQNGNYADKNPICEFVVERMGKRHTFTLQKAALTLSQISGQILEDGKTAYITISSFLGQNTDTEFNNLIKAYSQNGIENLTIDLRDNGGGSLQFALNMAETFVENGDLLCYFNERDLEKPTPVYSTTEKVSFRSVTILVNKNTASASELFARILSTKGVAKIIGERTVGKTMGQAVYTLPNNDFITITTYEMFDENLESYGEFGIVPDLEIQNVKMLYDFPKLGVFNHTNYVEINRNGYSDVTKALEDRLAMMGLIYADDADGYFDDTTSAALKIYQRDAKIEATGECTYDTVTKITASVNSYKYYTYYEDSQYDVAMLVHSSFSQGKRLVKEKEQLAKEQQELIAAKEAEIEAELDRLEEQNKAQAQADKETVQEQSQS